MMIFIFFTVAVNSIEQRYFKQQNQVKQVICKKSKVLINTIK